MAVCVMWRRARPQNLLKSLMGQQHVVALLIDVELQHPMELLLPLVAGHTTGRYVSRWTEPASTAAHM